MNANQLTGALFFVGRVALLALPHLNLMATFKGKDVQIRMVCVGTNFGFVPHLFFPKEEGANYVAPELIQQLERHRRNFTIFSGLDHGVEVLGGKGVHAFLSRFIKNSRGLPEKNISVDQKPPLTWGLYRYPSMH